MTLKPWFYAVALAGTLAMTACSSNGDNGEGATKPPVAPTATEQSSPDNSVLPDATPSPKPSATERPDRPSQEPQHDSAEAIEAKLIEIRKLAREGRVPGMSYAAHTSLIDDVEKDWGEADDTDMAGKGIYATYVSRHAAFGYNKGSVIFDVRSYAQELKSLSLRDIERTLGKADSVTANGDDDIYIYQVNKQYELKFVIPASKARVDHISVYSPNDTHNNMAG